MARRALAGALRAAYVMASRFARSGCPMPTVHLEDRALIAVEGADAETLPAEHRHHRPRRAGGRRGAGRARCCRRKARSCSISWSRATGENGFLLECRADAGRRFRAPADALQAARQGDDRQAGSGACRGFVGKRFGPSQTDSTGSQTDSTRVPRQPLRRPDGAAPLRRAARGRRGRSRLACAAHRQRRCRKRRRLCGGRCFPA